MGDFAARGTIGVMMSGRLEQLRTRTARAPWDAPARPRRARGFTLIELLVVVAIVALLLAILLPSLSAARESARTATCLSNLRQAFMACRMYADEHKGLGPALGQPYTAAPNWAVIVQQYSGMSGESLDELSTTRSVLSCPGSRAFYGRPMTRSYAMNVTGHAGGPGNRSSYDREGTTAHVRYDAVEFPSSAICLLDSAIAPIDGVAPPATRTASVIDFRSAKHVDERVGWVHAGRKVFDIATYGGSAKGLRAVPSACEAPLP